MTIFFDTETTGTPKNYKAPPTDTSNWPRIIQLAWMVCDDDKRLIRGFSFNIKPDGWIVEPGAEAVHGLSVERLMETGHPAPNIIQKFFEDCDECDTLVAHNMNFDFNVLACEAIRYRIRAKRKIEKKVCTMESTTDLLRLPGNYGKFKWPKLSELHEYLFGQNFDGAHDAMVDIQACARCYFELQNRGYL